MPAQAAFDALIRERIAPLMRSHGFRKQRNTFWIRGDRTSGVIAFQKSAWNDAAHVSFTVNVGIGADTLMPERRPDRPPPTWGCAIGERIGSLLPMGADKWWDIGDWRDVDRVASEVEDAITGYAIPFVRRFPDERALLGFWSRQLDGRELRPVLRRGAVVQLATALGDDVLAGRMQAEIDADAAEVAAALAAPLNPAAVNAALRGFLVPVEELHVAAAGDDRLWLIGSRVDRLDRSAGSHDAGELRFLRPAVSMTMDEARAALDRLAPSWRLGYSPWEFKSGRRNA